jgi:hypothetical protein
VTGRLGRDRPFPGLRPYAAADHAWFFGREEQSLALYRLLDRGRLVAVVGGSGSGKSSLVRAGLLPLLDEETAGAGGRRWWWRELRPGDAPIARLAEALAGEAPDDATAKAIHAARRERLDFILRRSSFGLLDALREVSAAAGTTPLILVDQFEELFRYADLPGSAAARAERREEAASFVQLLLEVSCARDPPVRVVLTMRSDYLGDCARFHGLPEAVTASQFLVPSLTRDQREQAIRGPIEKAGGSITDDLVERMLNDSSEELDQLPVLQHALMRTWDKAGERKQPETMERLPDGLLLLEHERLAPALANPPARRLTLADYRAVGGIAGAISQHADELLREPELQGRILAVEQVFRALAELDRQGRGIRRPLSFAQLVAETGVPETDVRAAVDRFRRDDCSFLIPPLVEDRPLGGKDVVDIGHEALIRRWTRVNREEGGQRAGWLWDETADGRTYRGLLSLIDGAKPGGRATLPFGQLRSRLRWWQERPRTSAWADRYDGRLPEVEGLFDHSRSRSRLVWAAVGVVTMILVGSASAVVWSWREAEKRAAEATASLIWSLLDFERANDPTSHAVRGLWQLATGNTLVRDAFLHQLAQDPYRVETLADGPQWVARAFGLRPGGDERTRLLRPVLAAIERTDDPTALLALAEAVAALAPRLGPGQAEAAVARLLAAAERDDRPYALRDLAEAVQALGEKVSTDAKKRTVEILLTPLAVTDESRTAAALAGAITAIQPVESIETYVADIAELLKWPTTTGEATDTLLDSLHQRVPNAPGKDAGLEATVAWIAKMYPNVDLTSPPEPPPSGSTGGGW